VGVARGQHWFPLLYTRRYQFLILCAHLFVRRLCNYHTAALMQPSVMLAHSIVGRRRSLGILICRNASDHDSPYWRTMPVGIAMLVNAALHIVVRRQHPDWDVCVHGETARRGHGSASKRQSGRRCCSQPGLWWRDATPDAKAARTATTPVRLYRTAGTACYHTTAFLR
jgi:hypothetical protein